MEPQGKVLLTVGLLLLTPGLLAATARRGWSPDALAEGWTGGLAAGVVLAWLGAWSGELSRAEYGLLPVMALLVILAWYCRRTPEKIDAARPGEWRWLALALTVIAAVAAVPVFASSWPPGWDPAFHSLLAKKIMIFRELSRDWLPFAAVPVNYPQGLHAFTAMLAEISGTAPHEVLQTCHWLFQIPAALLVYSLARTACGAYPAALAAMLSYGLLGCGGTFYRYYQWGGLPTEAGMLFFLLLIRLAWRERHDGWDWGLGILLWGAILVTHHLLLAIAVTVVIGYSAARLAFRRRLDPVSRFFWGTGLAALPIFSFYLLPYAQKALTIGQSGTIRFYDEKMLSPGALVDELGWWLPLAGLAGLVGLAAAFRRRRRGNFTPSNAGEESRPKMVFIVVWLAVLIAVFVTLDYGYRYLVAGWLYHDNFTAMVPSRWLSVTAYPLSILAGWAVAAGYRPWRRHTMSGGTAIIRRITTGLAVALMLGWGVERTVRLRTLSTDGPAQLQPIAATIAKATPPHALILLSREIPAQPWFAYLSWRSGLADPIPASEDRGPLFQKLLLFHDLHANREAIVQWLRETGHPCYIAGIRDRQLLLHPFP